MKEKNIPLSERIIVALDVDSPDKAKAIVKKCESHISFFKVGLQLFLSDWFNIVDWIASRGHKVMLDLKFFDIPETVKLAVQQVSGRGATYATIHGEDAIVRAAVAAEGDTKLLAVTVLTSFGQEDLAAMGARCSVAELVLARAQNAQELGCAGVVSSGHEARKIRKQLGNDLLIVTPGIRLGDGLVNPVDDQKRKMSPGAAILNGATQVVVGRPITAAKDPIQVIEMMQQEIIAVC